MGAKWRRQISSRAEGAPDLMETEMKKVMIGASIAALFALPALAADQGNVRPEQAPVTRADMLAQTAKRFAALDANKDGAITQAELDQAREAMKTRRAEQRKQRMDERFTRLDTDKNGQLSKAEFDAGYAARREGPASAPRTRGQGGSTAAIAGIASTVAGRAWPAARAASSPGSTPTRTAR